MVSFDKPNIYVGSKQIKVVSSTELGADEVTIATFESNKQWNSGGIEIVSCTIDEFSREAMDLLLGKLCEKYEEKKYKRLRKSKKARYRKWCKRYLNRNYKISCNYGKGKCYNNQRN